MDETVQRDNAALKVFARYMLIFGIGGAFVYWQTVRNKKAKKTAPARPNRNAPAADWAGDGQAAPSALKKKVEKAAKLKPKPKSPAASTPTNGAVSPSIDYNHEAESAADKDRDRDFALQMANAKSGHKFTTTKSDDKRSKSVKQSKAQEISDNAEGKTSVPSSTTGDADDDLSPANSPDLKAADSRDVSDMLEKSKAGPSILRLTSTDSVKTKEKKVKAAEVALTKKQRQNRKKAEEKKAQNEDAEQERKKLQEAQRRTARVAEGRSAKDGSVFLAQKDNAWDRKATNGDLAPSTFQPLDVYEQKPTGDVTNPSTPKAATSTKERSHSWMSSVPSEEEQLERLKELKAEESWNEVTSKKKGKKTREPATGNSANSTSTQNTVSSAAAAPKARVAVNGNKPPKPVLSSSSSFAALTPDETTDDNEVEEEWEV